MFGGRGENSALPQQIWEAAPWLVVATEDFLYCQQIGIRPFCDQARQRLEAGETLRAVLGSNAQKLAITKVKAVAWVPAVHTVLVRQHWLFDPWRLTITDAEAGERLFRGLAALIPNAGEPIQERVGPHDLALDPKLILGVILAIGGLIALVGGALEGVGQAPLMGPAARFRFLAEFGETLGVAGVLAIGASILAAGVFGLIQWYRLRPYKWIVRPM